jgi:DNA-binding CsgD family transcriptional regulator
MYSQWGQDITQQAHKEYLNWYYQFDNGKAIEYSSQYQGKALTNEDITSDSERSNCPLYNEFNRKFECENQLILGSNSGDYFTSIIATRPKKDGWFSEHETSAFELLSRNIVQSLRLSSHLQTLFGNHLALDRIIHDERNATIVVDDTLKVLWQSEAAEKLLMKSGDLSYREGKLTVNPTVLREQINRQVMSAISKSEQEREQCQTLKVTQNGSPLSLAIFASKRKTIFATDNARVATLVIRVPKEFSDGDAQKLRVLYNLTPAEAKLAIALANGLSLSDYANRNCKSIHTIRSALKTITSKTDTHSQAELVSVISRGV